MDVVAMLNQKGGVGKSTCCFHLSAALQTVLADRRTAVRGEGEGPAILLVDADPQASLSRGFFGPDEVEAWEADETIAEVFAGNMPRPSKVIRPTRFRGIDILGGSKAAKLYNNPSPEFDPRSVQECLRSFFADVEDRYDLVLIDCAPNLHTCSFAAMVGAGHLVVPLQPENFGAQGIRDVAESFEMVRDTINPDLRLTGYLLTMVAPKEAIHIAFEQVLRRDHGLDVFESRVPRATAYKEALLDLAPITLTKRKNGAPAKAIRAVAAELLDRIAGTPVVASTDLDQLEGEA